MRKARGIHAGMIETHDLDLNLLRVLAVLLAEGGVGRAARRLGRTQSAVSRSLGRLREAFDDPLFVRQGQRMVPTARAEAIRPSVERLLTDVERLLLPMEAYDPREARGALRLTGADMPLVLLVAPILERLSAEAPGLDLHVRPGGRVLERLESGELDVVLEVVGAIDHPELVRTPLREEGFACLVRRDHPWLADPTDLEAYAALEHVLVAPTGQSRGGVVDTALAKRGLRRRVRVEVPSFAAAPALVAGSDRVVTLPEWMAKDLGPRWDLVVVPPPIAVPRFTIAAHWMERRRTDPLHRWFRQVMRDASARV